MTMEISSYNLEQLQVSRSLLDHMTDAVYIVGIEGNIIYVNSSFEKMFGWSHQEVATDPFCMIPDHLLEIEMRVFEEIRTGKRIEGYETIRKRKDGTFFLVTLASFSICDPNGVMIGSSVLVKKNATFLRRKDPFSEIEPNYQKLIQTTYDIISLYDINLNKLMVSPSIEYHTGFTPEEFMRLDSLELIHPEDMKTINHVIEKIKAEKRTVEMVYRARHKLDRWIYIEGRAVPILNENLEVEKILLVCRNITEQKEAEEALKQSELRYRIIAENTLDLITVIDTFGKTIYVSPSHKKVLGYDPIEWENVRFKLIHPEDQYLYNEKLSNMIRTQEPSSLEYRFQHANGEWLYLESKGVPFFSSDGTIKGCVIITRDITKRKQSEELLRKTEKLFLIGQLAAGIAHEIRNPLTVLKGFIQFFRPQLKMHEDIVNLMLDELERINYIVSELLILSKPQPLEVKKVPLHKILEHVITLLGSEAALRNIQIIKEYTDDAIYIECDENQMKQVIINILKNAMEAISDHGEIRIATKVLAGKEVLISLTDNGCGIPEDFIAKLGEPFFTTKEKGTGLGLMISHKIIKEHGGTMNFISKLFEGTTVEIKLPIRK